VPTKKNGRVVTGYARRGDPSRPSREEAEHRRGVGAAGAHAVRSPTELRGIRQAALRPVCTKQQRSGWWGRVGRTHDHDEGQRDEHHTTDVRRRWRGKTLRTGGVGLMPDERKSKRKPKEKDCNRKVPLLQLSTYMRKGGQRGGCAETYGRTAPSFLPIISRFNGHFASVSGTTKHVRTMTWW
jgi:hypothetical protein